ncbi:phosphatidate cytidylyltransferase [Anabaena sp. FACHB-1237]|uniref:diacylglycerol/polyprenol kinase family protein n=1 Tax=Anabaena sp. FACHB-1237 TaxID=2692769 RepID=UPI001681A3D7|nr:diacylglycerol/polyprenol kinase family protein [Anabaena sp. FACHB-1237]MBD2139164.1 phosphatidate cytidylyltransferase [Anabaena sp. FACHB-1237]
MFTTIFAQETLIPLWLQILPAAAWVALIMMIAWLKYRFTNSETEIIRKIVHIGTGNVILIAWWLNIPAFVGIYASIIASIITLLSYKFPLLPGINSVGRHSLGTFFYAVSIGVLTAIFWPIHHPEFAALGIMIMAWGDGLAALIGKRFGKHKYQIFGSQKSWEGSLTVTIVSFFISSVILYSLINNIPIVCVISLMVALFATFLEAFSYLGVDNLTVPIGTAIFAYVLTRL